MAQEREIGFGVLGLGMGMHHCRAIDDAKGAKLIAACDIDEERLNRAVEQHGIKGYTDYEDMLNDDDIEVINVCVPSGMHVDMAIPAIEAGKNVIVEKPVDIKVEKINRLIEVGKKVKLGDLLHGMVIQSGNDASVALAEYISGAEDVFADLMNKHAERLGMKNTHFVNSTGLPDENHYTTARDLAILARAYINDFPEEYKLNQEKEFTYNKIKQHNRNKLLWRDRSVDGIKTGHTEEAGYCLVASAVRDGMRLISVVMGTDGMNARATASQALLNYGYRFFETHKLYSAGDLITSVKVWKADKEMINLGLNKDLYITVPRGQYEKLEPVVEIDTKIIAPVNLGEQKGILNVMLTNEKVVTVPLLALETVSEGGIVNRLKDEVRLLFE